MGRTRVQSSSIASVSYDGATSVLEVEFVNGSVYRYFGVPRSVYEAFLGAESLGRHFNATIRSRYPSIKV